MTEATITQEQFNLLMARLDRIEEHLAEQRRRADELEELKHDLIPIGNQMFKLAIDELAEIGSEFTAEDLFFLLKRLLRDTHLLLQALDQLESIMGLAEEMNRLMRPMFNTMVEELDRLERMGLFTLAKAGWVATQQIASNIQPEDVDKLSQDVGNILAALKETPAEAPSMVTIMKEMRDPQVRKGLARSINLLKALGGSSEAA